MKDHFKKNGIQISLSDLNSYYKNTNPLFEYIKNFQTNHYAINPELYRIQDMFNVVGETSKKWSSIFPSPLYMDNFTSARSALLGLADNMNNVLASFRDIIPNQLVQQVAFNYKELIQSQNKLLELFGTSYLKDYKLASEKIIDSIASLQVMNNLCNLPSEVTRKSLEITDSYQTFARKQYKTIEKNNNAVESAISITEYSGNMVLRCNSITELASEFYDKNSDDESLSLRTDHTNIFPMLNLHLSNLYRRDFSKTEINEKIEESLPAKIHHLGCQIFEIIYEINCFSQILDSSCIFTPTNKTFLAASYISSYVASDPIGFSNIIDCLYFEIYEGSGYAKRINNFFNNNLPHPVLLLKHLRNEFRHDLEHGKENEIKQKVKNGGNAFFELIGKHRPLTPFDWKKTQVSLYELLVIMLSMILTKLGDAEPQTVS